MNNQNQLFETNNFRVDLISSLFGQQISQDILKDDLNPTKLDPNYVCPHPILIDKICTKCGFESTNNLIHTIPFRYIYPNLSITLQEINRIRDDNLRSLLNRKKLHLVIDLDHTLLHHRAPCKLTKEDNKFLRTQKRMINHNLFEIGELYKLPYGVVKLRPYVRDFLAQASEMFDMTVYTLGDRSRSWTVTKLLDPKGVYFDNWRVITREDSLDKHKKSLDFVLEHEKVIVVLDDNASVWEDFKGNYVRVIPYNYFSFFSPGDEVRDASPPRESWSQLRGDESLENGVLRRVLAKLRIIHAAFYEGDGDGDGGYSSRDVREVIRRVEMEKSSQKKKYQKKKTIGRIV